MLRLRTLLMVFVALVLVAQMGLLNARADDSDPRALDGTSVGRPVALGPEWLFHPGDDLAWAAPGFNDAEWRVVDTRMSLNRLGYRDLLYGWYRIHVTLPPGQRSLSIATEHQEGAYELYANGVRVGGQGEISGHGRVVQASVRQYAIPDRVLTPNRELVIAIRVALTGPMTAHSDSSSPVSANDGVMLIEASEWRTVKAFYDTKLFLAPVLLVSLSGIVGLVALALFLVLPKEREYAAAAVYLLANSVLSLILCWELHTLDTGSIWQVVRAGFFGLGSASLLEFIRLVLRRPRTRWLLWLEIYALVAGFASPLSSAGFGNLYVDFSLFFFPLLTIDLLFLVLLFRPALKGSVEARILLPAVLTLTCSNYLFFIRYVLLFTGLTKTLVPTPGIAIGAYNIPLQSDGVILFDLTILLFLVVRTVGIARERARIGAELEAARTTQQLLMARQGQATPGFLVESVYYPASEVGGDFFLVSSGADGALMVIVGDVSGKGLIAAMRVAMILGVLRREDSREPRVVLQNLNESLLNDDGPGFATACCVRLEADGGYTLANAGHIAPYVGGAEIATPPALPLGLASGLEYEGVSGRLAEGQAMVLMSDGVLEARAASGELLGFERMTQLTLEPANAIADKARSFGQEDDITVLTVACVAWGL